MKSSIAIKTVLGTRNAKKMPTDIATICKMSIDDIVSRGISFRDAARIRAAIELSREIAEPTVSYNGPISSPSRAIEYCKQNFSTLARHGKQEEFWIITLDTKLKPIHEHRITVGTLNNSLVHPREVFRPAILDSAHSVVLMHNHPSGDVTPSDADQNVTNRLKEAGNVLGIGVIDHIIVGGNDAISIEEFNGR